MIKINEKVAKVILTTPGVFRSIASDPAILVGRKISPYYIDNRKIYSFPEQRITVVDAMVDLVTENDVLPEKPIKKITTMETAGIPISALVGHEMNIGTTYVKKKAKAYGLGRKIEGVIEKGEYIIGVDDLATEGGSAEIAVNAVRQAGGEIDKYLVIFDRKQGATERLAKLNVELQSLAQMSPEFINIGLEIEAIDAEEGDLFGKYSENPNEWSRNYIRENPDFLKNKLAGVIKLGHVTDMAPLEVLTKGHPELKEEFEPKVREWLAELEVRQHVKDFNYSPYSSK